MALVDHIGSETLWTSSGLGKWLYAPICALAERNLRLCMRFERSEITGHNRQEGLL
ncbi:hypothetical protein J4419_04410 [Candidatus Woesearchaeota archaeon]|nr:hypothetical protein [Candidatus Woesearchaeota archaeon]